MKKNVLAITVINECEDIEIITPSLLLSDSFGIVEIPNVVQGNFYSLPYDMMERVEMDSAINTIDISWYCPPTDKLYHAKANIGVTLKEEDDMIIIKLLESGRINIYIGSEEIVRLVYDSDFRFSTEGKEGKNAVYNYRYCVQDGAVGCKALEQIFSDGSYDFCEVETQSRYRMHGIPELMKLVWDRGNSEFTSYFSFESLLMKEMFGKFYGVHRETKADFIIDLSQADRIPRFSLFRQGLRESIPIPLETYQFMVFENGFECIRSDGFDSDSINWF